MNQHGRVAAAMERLLQLGGCAAVGRTVGIAGAPLHYLEAGAGAPIVLIHGGSGGGANWFRMLAPLARGHLVLAPDLPGFGLSPRRDPVPPLGAAAAVLLEEWLRALGVRGALVAGTSFGGIAALRLAQRAPDLVDRLFLLDAAGLGRSLSPLLRCAALPLIAPRAMRPTRAGTARMFRVLLTSDRSRLTAAMQDALVDYLYASAEAAGTNYLVRTLRMFAGVRGQREFLDTAELRALERPAAVVMGERDPFFDRAAARRAAAALPHATFHVIPAVGHSPNWEAPDAVLEQVRELAAR